MERLEHGLWYLLHTSANRDNTPKPVSAPDSQPAYNGVSSWPFLQSSHPDLPGQTGERRFRRLGDQKRELTWAHAAP